MNIQQVEKNLSKITIPDDFDINFVYELLSAYGKPKSSITRLRSGTYNLSKKPEEVYWKKNLFFKFLRYEDLHIAIDNLRKDKETLRHDPRFIIVTDFEQLLAVDTKTQETLDIEINELPKHYAFFLPWAGMEKASAKTENLADIKAAARMARLYDEIRKENSSIEPEFIHALNIFFSRLLFCFFAEDTDVFSKRQFTNSVSSHTQLDGSDVSEYLDRLFDALDTEDKTDYPEHLRSFPYVNGGLFGKKINSPRFSAQARRILLECGELNWSQINPDIFGSMIQAVVHPSQRESLGMHYTSVVNIMKVIEPLFLDQLKEELVSADIDEKKLINLLHRIQNIKIFDPACGSGNFLIIAYKELRKLEHEILKRFMEGKLKDVKLSSGIRLENFYGIEIDDFAHEIGILSLWLAKHQMNQEIKELFNITIPLVPLKDAGYIVCGNATRLDWLSVCPSTKTGEIYLISNPPYLGSRNQKNEHKEDLKSLTSKFRSLDYISAWFIKGAEYIRKSDAKLAFVSTNSITQGEQVGILWPDILRNDIEIGFAHTSFKWTNNAKGNAGVVCIIVSLRKKSSEIKRIYTGQSYLKAEHINPYLAPADDVYVFRRSKPLADALPKITYGSMINDAGNLILSKDEKDELIAAYPASAKFIKRFIGSSEFLKGQDRWCLKIDNLDLDEALSMDLIKDRLERVSMHREQSSEKSTRLLALTPHKFYFSAHKETDAVIIPRVSSMRRHYIPIGYLDSNTIISDAANAIYDVEPWVFGIVSSRMHMVWVRAVAGRLKTDFRYSAALVYNNFPLPSLSEKQKQMITTHAFEIISVREAHSEKTLAEMYDPNKMPKDLYQAHADLDEVVERCYRSKPFETDEERLGYLFKLYKEMTIDAREKTYA